MTISKFNYPRIAFYVLVGVLFILGFIFYKYLSEKMESFANELLEEDEVLYTTLENNEDDKEYLTAIKEDAIDELGFFLNPWELF